MNDTKVMCRIIPAGSCPRCGHRQFIVDEIAHNRYLLNRDGEVIDEADISYTAVGMCVKCNATYNMIPTRVGFIPASKIRAIMYEFTPHNIQEIPEFVKDEDLISPMEAHK